MAAASINIVHARYRQVSADVRGGRHLAIVQNLVGLKMRQLKYDGPWSVIISNAYSRDHHLHKTCYAGTKEYPSLGLADLWQAVIWPYGPIVITSFELHIRCFPFYLFYNYFFFEYLFSYPCRVSSFVKCQY